MKLNIQIELSEKEQEILNDFNEDEKPKWRDVDYVTRMECLHQKGLVIMVFGSVFNWKLTEIGKQVKAMLSEPKEETTEGNLNNGLNLLNKDWQYCNQLAMPIKELHNLADLGIIERTTDGEWKFRLKSLNP